MAGPPQTIDDYLASLSEDKRAALEKLRAIIRSAVPDGEECISYGVPGVRLDGRLLVSFGAGKNHCALYPGAFPLEALRAELTGYDTSKGTIRFPANKPLPAALVRKLVRARTAERGTRPPGRKRSS